MSQDAENLNLFVAVNYNMSISKWLEKFKNCWQSHDVDGILSLFYERVAYYETPFLKLEKKSLTEEWQNIVDQKNINLNLEIFSSFKDKHSVIWELSYFDKENVKQKMAGIYLIELDGNGKCIYFYQVGEVLAEA